MSNNVIGLGVDIVEIDRIGRLLEKHGERFLGRVYTEAERQRATEIKQPATFLAGRWAAKEAVYKALQADLTHGIGWQEIEIVRSESGAPTVRLSGNAAKSAKKAGIGDVLLSISHSKDSALAQVIALGSVEKVGNAPERVHLR